MSGSHTRDDTGHGGHDAHAAVAGPGLDPAAVAAHLSNRTKNVSALLERIGEHVDSHGGYVAWSGGRDSTVVVHLASQAVPDVPVVWFDSGLEFPDTGPYIRRLAEQWSLNLDIIRAEPDALTVLARTGVWDHAAAYDPHAPDLHETLILAPARTAHARYGAGEISGLRAQESVGRRALLAPGDGVYRRADGTVVYAPVWAWNSRDVRAYLAGRGVPENPVYARLAAVGAPERAQRVGLAVDGNNPDFGRFTYLRLAYPDLWAQVCQVLPRLREWR